MAKTKISEYSSTANSNTDIASINIDEGCAPSGINNAIRALMAQIHDLYAGTTGDTWPVTAGGTGSGTASGARTNLGLVIGTDVQAYDADLAAIASSGKGAEIASYGTYGVGFKNRIINGAMGIWQRGTGPYTTNVYSADRWYVGYYGTSISVTRSSDVPSGFQYSMSLTGVGSPTVIQRIEAANAFDLAGQSVTFSLWAKSTSGNTSLGLWIQYANSADNFLATTSIASQTVTTTGSWARYSVTFTNLPSGVANGLQAQFFINDGGSGGGTMLITGVQLEKGSTATSFDYRPYGTELALCQRYCQRYSNGRLATGGWTAVTNGDCYLPFVQQFRATPTFTALANGQMLRMGTAWYNITVVTLLNESTPNFAALSTTIASSSGVTVGDFTILGNGGGSSIDYLFTSEL